jgi:hypothetical protein
MNPVRGNRCSSPPLTTPAAGSRAARPEYDQVPASLTIDVSAGPWTWISIRVCISIYLYTTPLTSPGVKATPTSLAVDFMMPSRPFTFFVTCCLLQAHVFAAPQDDSKA